MPETNTPVLQFRLFGSFEAKLNGAPISRLHLRKGERLMAYLILNATRWVERDELARLFWGDEYIEDPEANLRQSLMHIRSVVGGDLDPFETRSGAIRINSESISADTFEFCSACSPGTESDLNDAKLMLEEGLLVGWDDKWIGSYRDKLNQKLSIAFGRLAPGPMHFVGSGSELSDIGGALLPDSGVYIKREADAELDEALSSMSSIITIKGARQTGKSSLLARGIILARAQGWNTRFIDLEQFSVEDITNPERFYIRLLAMLAEQQDEEFDPDRDFKKHLGQNGNFERFVRRRILSASETPVLIAFDGADRLFETTYYGEFFALIRGFHTRRATEQDVPWGQLTIILAAATEAHLYIRDLDQSPFNVGVRIKLNDFNEAQSQELGARSGRLALSISDYKSLRSLLGGQPYLLGRAFEEMKTRNIGTDEFLILAVRSGGPFHDHLSYLWRAASSDIELIADLKNLLDGGSISETGFLRLRTSGLIIGDSPPAAAMRCGLYKQHFQKRLAE